MFKVGDWVRNTKLNRVFQYSYSDLNYDLANPSHCKDDELWLPKEGEWVICGLSNTDDAFWVIKYNEHEVISLSEYNPHEDVIIQPFLGELPSFLKESR